MADDDEIDVLGDFNLDNYLTENSVSIYNSALVSQNTELLNCDYTIHPQWLLDRPSADPDNWYDSSLSTGLTENTSDDNDNIGHVSTENSITDESGWTENEKNLLERGIDIFGKSNVRLSQFIGSKTASEVKYYLKNFYSENHNSGLNNVVGDGINTNLASEVLDDTQIPASIEEVIAAVSTAKPTVQTNTPKSRKKSSSSFSAIDSQVASYKNSSGNQTQNLKYVSKANETSGKGVRHKVLNMYMKNRKMKMAPAKFKVKAKLIKYPLKDTKSKDLRNIEKPKIVKIMNQQSKKAEYGRVYITTGRGLTVPISEGEEIVKLKKPDEDSDTDVEIDVEMTDEEKEFNNSKVVDVKCINQEKTLDKAVEGFSEIETPKSIDDKSSTRNIQDKAKDSIDLSNLDKSTVNLLTTLDEPTSEYVIDENIVTDIEKVINSEYFEGKPSKTPSRYITIRNHILKGWKAHKPNYLKKTLSRKNLKNCGDVNCFGRIHNFLEQIGAINFGCDQVIYFRPLSNLIQDQPTTPREKSIKEVKQLSRSASDITSRPRSKMKKFNNDGEGGCTLAHDEEGHVINTTVINEEPVVKQRFIKKPTVRLIYSRPFNTENPQPYRITINLSTLLIMDFHAHTSLTEVMGLVAGYWIPDTKTLEITHYEPCLNIASSATHCDMCPISQAKAAESIHGNGLDILGWFHSHPTFAPEPSQQDLETQQVVQQWIGNSNPCIGVILSPFSLNGALIASPFRCMIVDKKMNFEDQFVPYKFKVEVISERFVLVDFLKDLKRILRCYNMVGSNNKGSRVDFAKPYYQDNSISFMEKYITSVRMHLARCGTLDKMSCDSIIHGITLTCSNKVKQ